MADYKRDVSEIIRELMRQGWRIRKNKHWVVYPPLHLNSNRRCVVLASSPSDRRAMLNVRSELRKAGAKLP